jgi:hypothetical protein
MLKFSKNSIFSQMKFFFWGRGGEGKGGIKLLLLFFLKSCKLSYLKNWLHKQTWIIWLGHGLKFLNGSISDVSSVWVVPPKCLPKRVFLSLWMLFADPGFELVIMWSDLNFPLLLVWLFRWREERVRVNQHPPANHPLDDPYDSVVDEPQLS